MQIEFIYWSIRLTLQISVFKKITTHYYSCQYFNAHKRKYYDIILKISNMANLYMSRPMGKQTSCICENKDADQLRGNHEADQRLCFRYSDSTVPLLLNPKFPTCSHLLCLYRPVCVRPIRKPHYWYFHEMAHMLYKFEVIIRTYAKSCEQQGLCPVCHYENTPMQHTDFS